MSLKSKIQALITAANAKTGETDATLTDAVQTLVDGFGGITPSGSVTLTSENTYDVTEKATAIVDFSATRADLAEAVTAKGVDTLPTSSFDTIATNIGLISGGAQYFDYTLANDYSTTTTARGGQFIAACNHLYELLEAEKPEIVGKNYLVVLMMPDIAGGTYATIGHGTNEGDRFLIRSIKNRYAVRTAYTTLTLISTNPVPNENFTGKLIAGTYRVYY